LKIRITTNCEVSGRPNLTHSGDHLFKTDGNICVLTLITQWFEQSKRHRLFQRVTLRKLCIIKINLCIFKCQTAYL